MSQAIQGHSPWQGAGVGLLWRPVRRLQVQGPGRVRVIVSAHPGQRAPTGTSHLVMGLGAQEEAGECQVALIFWVVLGFGCHLGRCKATSLRVAWGGVSRPLGSRPPASPQPAVFFAVRKPPTSCASTSDQLRLNQATRRPTHIPNLLQQKSNRGRLSAAPPPAARRRQMWTSSGGQERAWQGLRLLHIMLWHWALGGWGASGHVFGILMDGHFSQEPHCIRVPTVCRHMRGR